MHEALITRDDARNLPDPEVIMVRENCVLRHHVCPDGVHSHTAGHGGAETWEACARQLVTFEGAGAVHGWLKDMDSRFLTAGCSALLRFEAIDFSLERQLRISSSDTLYRHENTLEA